MTSADDLFDQSTQGVQRLGLTQIPFTESPGSLGTDTLKRVFTGRVQELRQVFNLLQSRESRRILVSGRLGIGKSAFLLEVLGVLSRKKPKLLTSYISLPAGLDLATTALIALALKLPDDEWAQRQLYQMGIPTEKLLKERSSEVSASMGLGGKIGEKDLPIVKPQVPSVNFEVLLERALQAYPEGVLIAIDDLDKQNPTYVRQLLLDAQGVLKGKAWFMLTGHPTGITGDLVIRERGLFDLHIPLHELDFDTTRQMLINYLNSVRQTPCTDLTDPRCFLPFLPETADRLCRTSLGKPRLFNRLGSAVLLKAIDLGVDQITPEVLDQGLQSAAQTQLEQAALNVQEQRARRLLQERGQLDDTISLAELQRYGFSDFTALVPILELLEEKDLAHRLNLQGATILYEPIALPFVDDDLHPEDS